MVFKRGYFRLVAEWTTDLLILPQRGQDLEGLQGETEKGMLIDHGPPRVQGLAGVCPRLLTSPMSC